MALKLDETFREDYEKYFGDFHPFTVTDLITKDMKLLNEHGELIINSANIIKTCDTMGMTYFRYCEELSQRICTIFPEDMSLELFMFELAFTSTHFSDLPRLESFLKRKFRVRDIYKEIAMDYCGSPDCSSEVKEVKTEDTYSIQRPRPESRDKWFYDLAVSVGSYSQCHSRKIGAVLVRDKSVISTGYNGPPRGVPTCDQRWHIDKAFKAKYVGCGCKFPEETQGKCPRHVIGFKSGEGLEVCVAGHAERNALINAARLGVPTLGTTMYMSCGVPCSPCMVELINAGVDEIVCSSMHIYDESAMYLLENSTIKVRLFDFLKKKV